MNRGNSIRNLTLASASAAALLASPAYAQEADDTGGLAEIIVTAQKRSENLQDVPAAISVIDGNAMLAKGIVETTDLMGALPNLQVTSPYGKTQPNFSLRGVGVANEFSASTSSAVGVYVDEVYQSFRASHGQQLYDLERVEVLRGPQGTLYGRNTTGGAINFITRKPSLQGTNGYITAGYGNRNTYEIEGASELTFADDRFGMRFAGTLTKGDGYTRNPVDGKKYGGQDSIAGRISLRFKPSETIDINLKVYAAKNDALQDLPYGIGYLAGRSNAGGYSRFAPRPELGGRLLKRNEVQADTGGTYFTASKGFSLTVEGELSDNLTLTSITGFDRSDYQLSPFDCDGSPIDICAIRYRSDSDNFNQDLRLNYEGSKLKLIAGLYYGKDTIDTVNEPDFFGFLKPILLGAGVPGGFGNVPIGVGNSVGTLPAFLFNPALRPTTPGYCAPVVVNPNGLFDARSLIAFQTDVATTNSAGGTASQGACAAAGAPPFTQILARQQFTISRPSSAVYGEASYAFNDKFKVTLGLRYTWDKVKYSNGRSVIFNLAETAPVASLVPYSFPFNANLPAVAQKTSTGRLTGRIVADYKFSDDVLAYVSFSRGYRSGTYNGLAYQDISQVYFVNPEKVDAYEGGIKTRFADNRVQLNLAAFYYDYANQQIAQVIGATSFLRNARGRMFGAEAELDAALTDSLRVDASLGLLNTKYKGNAINAADPRSLTLNINGNPFPNAPKVTFAAGVEFDLFKGDDSGLTIRADAQYMGRYYFDPFKDYGQNPCDKPRTGTLVLQATPELACGNPGYWLFNSRATYKINDKASVGIWGKNITNKFYYVYGLNLNAFYQDYLTRGAPRSFGIDATLKF